MDGDRATRLSNLLPEAPFVVQLILVASHHGTPRVDVEKPWRTRLVNVGATDGGSRANSTVRHSRARHG
jgi:hypothetical protein